MSKNKNNMIISKKIFKFYANVYKSEGSADTDFYVEGYASTSGLDRQGDIIVLDALKRAARDLVEINNTVFYGHSYDLENAVGRIVDATVDDYGLKVRIYVSSWAKELRTKLKEGIINKFSIGGRVVDDETISKQEAVNRGLVDDNCPFDQIHIIKKIELYEVSFVGVPANPEAQVVQTFAKALESLYKGGEYMEEKKELEQKQEELKEEEINKEEDKKEEEHKEEEHKEEEHKEEQHSEEEKKELESKEEEETKEEISEEEIKDLLEDTEEKKEEKKPYYYYYYGKGVMEKLDKIGEAIADLSKKIEELTKFIKEKVKTIEAIDEKKSVIKNNKPLEEKKEVKEEDVDSLFLKFLKGEN